MTGSFRITTVPVFREGRPPIQGQKLPFASLLRAKLYRIIIWSSLSSSCRAKLANSNAKFLFLHKIQHWRRRGQNDNTATIPRAPRQSETASSPAQDAGLTTQKRHGKEERFEPKQPIEADPAGVVWGQNAERSRFPTRRLGRKLKLRLIVIESLLSQIDRTMDMGVRTIINEGEHHLD